MMKMICKVWTRWLDSSKSSPRPLLVVCYFSSPSTKIPARTKHITMTSSGQPSVRCCASSHLIVRCCSTRWVQTISAVVSALKFWLTWTPLQGSFSSGTMCAEALYNDSFIISNEKEHNLCHTLLDTLVEYQSGPLMLSYLEDTLWWVEPHWHDLQSTAQWLLRMVMTNSMGCVRHVNMSGRNSAISGQLRDCCTIGHKCLSLQRLSSRVFFRVTSAQLFWQSQDCIRNQFTAFWRHVVSVGQFGSCYYLLCKLLSTEMTSSVMDVQLQISGTELQIEGRVVPLATNRPRSATRVGKQLIHMDSVLSLA